MKLSRVQLNQAITRPGKRGGMVKEYTVKDGYAIDLDPASGLIRISMDGDERLTHVSNMSEGVPVRAEPKPAPAAKAKPEAK